MAPTAEQLEAARASEAHDATTRSALAALGYLVDGVLGRGGFGVVYRARRQVDNALVAIKVALPEQVDGAGRLAREAAAMDAVGPPHVPRIFGQGVLPSAASMTGPASAPSYFVALGYVPARTLADHLVLAAGPMPIERFAEAAAAMLRPLEAVHARGYVHRDLKPENVFLDESNRATLIDFGLAKHVGGEPAIEEVTSADAMGTAEYMSPEQCDGLADADKRADVYSVGILFYEMLNGSPPFHGQAADVREAQRSRRPPPLGARAGCPPELDAFVRKCLAKDRTRRFDDATAVRRALETVMATVTTWEPASQTRPSLSPVMARHESLSPPKPAAPAPPARDKRTMGLVFFESAAGIGAVQPVLTASGGQVVQTNGTQYVAAFGHDVGDNPARSALVAAQRLLLADLSSRLLVDVASVSVQVRPDGSRRVFSAAFTKKDRLPSATDPTGVLLTRAALDVIPDVGVVGVPGRDDRFRLEGQGTNDDSTSYGLRSSATVGRDALLQRLAESAARSLVDAEPTVVTVVGEGGYGRTHIAGAAATQVAQLVPSVDVIKVTAQEAIVGAVSPTLRDLVQRLLKLPSRAPEDGGRALFAERLGPALGEQVWVGGAFASGWITAEHPQLRPLVAAPGALRLTAARAVGEVLRYRASQKPIALVLDDAHLADDVTLDALEYATLREAGARLWALVLVRPAFERGRPNFGTRAARCESIPLGPLEPHDAAELARRLLQPIEHVPPAALARLAERTQGVPRLLVELVRGLKRDGLVRRSERGTGYYLATDELEKLPDIPVLQWNASREIEALPAQVAGHARLSSILGANFTVDELEKLLQLLEHDGELLEDMQLDASVGIQRLVDVGVLTRHRSGLIDFRHPLLRDTVYQLVPDAQKKQLHRAAYQLYEQAPANDERRLPRLALHAARSGAHEAAVEAYLTLAERSTAANAYLEAEAAYARAFESMAALAPNDPRRVDGARARALVRLRLGRHEDALADLRHGREQAAALGDAIREAELLIDESTVLDWTREFATSASRVAEVEALNLALPELVAAKLEMARCRVHHRRAEPEASVRIGSAAAEMAKKLGDAGYETHVICLLMIAPDCALLNRLDDAERFFEEVLGAAESHGDLQHVGAASVNRALLWFVRNDVDRLFADLSRAVQIAREIGSPLLEFSALYSIGEVEYAIERLDQGTAHSKRALELGRQLWGNDSRELAGRELLLARIALYRNDLDEARALTTRLLERASRLGADPELAFSPADAALLEMMDLAVRGGNNDEWEALRARCKAIELQSHEEVEMIEMQALARAREGRFDEAVRLLKAASDVSVQKPNLLGKRVERRLAALAS